MKSYAFNYNDKFKCIADKCTHSCCKGWGVCIDKKSLKRYKKDKSEFSSRLKTSIDFKNSCFILDKNKRCLFLNDDNLCDLIIAKGENALCQVCRDHPRFRSFFKGRVETGLGLSCEEACRIILSLEDKMSLIPVDERREKLSKFDKKVLAFRKNVLFYLQDRKLSIGDRINAISCEYGIRITKDTLTAFKDFLLTLEILDAGWLSDLTKIVLLDFDLSEIESQTVIEQLLCYFIYRHVSTAKTEEELLVKLIFSLLSTEFIISVAKSTGQSVFDVARSYSAEIEYSNDNLDKIYDYIDRNHRLERL